MSPNCLVTHTIGNIKTFTVPSLCRFNLCIDIELLPENRQLNISQDKNIACLEIN